MFGISPIRWLLYGGALALLVGLNVYRLSGAGPDAVAGDQPAVQVIPDLPDIAALGDEAGDSGQPGRDLFRNVEPPPPPPEPVEPEPEPEPEPEAPPADPRAEAIVRANQALDGIKLVGLMSSGPGMVAVYENDDSVETVFVGDEMIPGFVVREITMVGVVVENNDLGLRRELRMTP